MDSPEMFAGSRGNLAKVLIADANHTFSQRGRSRHTTNKASSRDLGEHGVSNSRSGSTGAGADLQRSGLRRVRVS